MRAQLAAAAYLARCTDGTLDSYRTDLRQFFQWADNVGLAPLEATRPHIELYRAWMDERGLTASTVDRRRSAATTASSTSTSKPGSETLEKRRFSRLRQVVAGRGSRWPDRP